MANSISERQNKKESLRKLLAQRTLYSRAKKYSSFRLFLIVIVTIIISLVHLALNDPFITSKLDIKPIDISWFVTTSGIIFTLITQAVLNPVIRKLKEKAAKIQELFDNYVYDIPWDKTSIGVQPSHELINQNSSDPKTNKDNYKDLKDWYSDISDKIPKHAQILICQASNLSWDTRLRTNYSIFNLVLTAVLTLILLVIGLYLGLTLRNFFLIVIAPALPMIIYSLEQYHNNKESLEELSELTTAISDTWDDLVKRPDDEVQFEPRIRSIQNKLYMNRKNNPLIFDWFYNRYKDDQHDDMYYSIKKMIKEYKNK